MHNSLKMILRSFTLAALLLLMHPATVSAQNRPPAIVSDHPRESYYQNGFPFTMPCVASGTPAPSYVWKKNGVQVIPGQNGVSMVDGNLTVNSPAEGYYQCIATNTFGAALSSVTWLREVQSSFPNPDSPKYVSVNAGSAYTMPCTLSPGMRFVPDAYRVWQTVTNTTSRDSVDVPLDKRIQVTEDGNLTFAYVTPGDYQSGRLYRCHLTNTQLNSVEVSVAYTGIRVNSTPVQPTQLTNLFSYSYPSIALEGNSVSLRCFFGGGQNIDITWTKPDGSAPVGSRYQSSISGLTISGVQKSDEGTYTCTASTPGFPSTPSTVNLQVRAAPTFRSDFDRPHDANFTNDDNVVINCNPYANPNASVKWYLNGVEFDANTLRSKFQLSTDTRTLTISKVCKSCSDGTINQSDLMVIQCNASNIYGYAFANGYVNVLDRTVIKVAPVNTFLDYPKPVQFTCNATSDVATEVLYHWTYNGAEISNDLVNSSVPGVLRIDVAGDNAKGSNFLGLWSCNATNGVSSDVRGANLSTVMAAGVSWWWWIPFIVILLFLLAIALILLICCCCYRNRGDAYPVDEEERKGGNDPVKELHEIGFHDFQRPVDAPDGVILQTPVERARHGQGSISSSIGKAASDDEMSLDNYSNINHGKFTEDGSFLGQYNPNSRRQQYQFTNPAFPESSA